MTLSPVSGMAILGDIPILAEFSTPSISSTQADILTALKKADVIYLGETHDEVADHQGQLQIIQALYANNSRIAIAFEMFQRPYQPVLDQYLQGIITEAQLIQASEYENRWGFPWEYYRDIVRFAQRHQLPMLAANTPTEVTRKVAKSGLASLTPEDQTYIPPLAEIKTDNAAYWQMLLEIFQVHAQAHGQKQDSQARANDQFNNFFAAQVLWDETMAEVIADFLQSNPDYQVVVIVGEGHVVYGHGIPSRVARRLGSAGLVQYSVLFQSPQEEMQQNPQMADFIWQH
ncbi:MAG: ChaN family lipoprotein [Oscillatoriales cyanobacterium RM2_1_1]|nr:ChaN family lipoprotein [Oscillatoriales cyanobacterium SM2_3_0]NJO46355.1 ChaN family lipoprotein [Oscillatoriales cyanobacterium RM2_1_1]